MSTRYPVPDRYPSYSSRTLKSTHSHSRLYTLCDAAFALAGLVMAFWFAWLLLLSGLVWNWRAAILLIVFWAVLTYLALPRLHQTFTTLYVPDYFMARTKTGDGLLGDPINLALMGSEADLHAAMTRAGWTKADPITIRSSLGIILSSLRKTSYPQAPVSNLFLFGRRHDFAYQQEVDGNALQRHHVRFWHTPKDWDLPGGRQVDWLAAGTYDTSVGLSSWTLQITHKIDADIDAERDYIIDSVRFTDPESEVDVIDHFTTAYHDRNGGGDAVHTDGDMPVLDLSGAAERATRDGYELPEQSSIVSFHHPSLDRSLDHEIPPLSLTFSGIILVLQAIITGTSIALSPATWNDPNSFEDYLTAALLLAPCAVSVVNLILFVLSLKRQLWARLLLLFIVTISTFWALSQVVKTDEILLTPYMWTGLSVLAVLSLSAPAIRAWIKGKSTPSDSGDTPAEHLGDSLIP